MKEATHHKNYINGFSEEKILVWGNHASVLEYFFFILCNERVLEMHENRVNGFSKICHILS